VTTGASFRVRWLVTRLMTLAVFAMMFGQVVTMPSATLSSNEGSFDQRSAPTQTSLEQEESSVPCHHNGDTQGLACCFAGVCAMLTLALPVVPSAALKRTFRLLPYRHDAMSSPDGTGAAPLLPPPRYLV
jgi:hypothetical protein